MNWGKKDSDNEIDNNFRSALLAFVIFGSVQVFSVLSKIIINKAIALLLGPNGIGLAAYWTSVLSLIRSISIFGVDQSSVREIAKFSNSEADQKQFHDVAGNAILYFNLAGIIGLILSLLFCLLYISLSEDIDNLRSIYILACFPSAVYFTIRQFGEMALLRGMLCRREIAYGMIFGLILGALSSVIALKKLDENAIFLSLLLVPLFLFFSLLYFRKSKSKIPKTNKALIDKYKDILKLLNSGAVLAISNLLGVLVQFLVIFFLDRMAGTHVIGLYNAGVFITVGYFTVLLNALSTDFFPRLSSVVDDDCRSFSLINDQAVLSILMIFPMLYLFFILQDKMVFLLYSANFLGSLDYLLFAVWGVAITTLSNQLDLLLIVRTKMKAYLLIGIALRIVELCLHVVLYQYLELLGLGLAVFLSSIIHFSLMYAAAHYYFNFRYNLQVFLYILMYFLVFVSFKWGSVYLHWDYKTVNIVDGLGMLIVSFISVYLIRLHAQHKLAKVS